VLDTKALKETWQHVAGFGDEVPLYFYSYLFVAHPEVRDLFPIQMLAQRDKLVGALGQVVSNVDDLGSVVPALQQLGRDHRRFEAVAGHYPAVGAALLATLERFLGPLWTEEVAESWTTAYTVVSQTMLDAANEAEKDSPSWYEFAISAREQRTADISVLELTPAGPPLPYRPGQSTAVETHLQPRVWRYYSPANAPNEDGRLTFHVRYAPGGLVSGALVQRIAIGDVLRLGAPVGTALTLEISAGRDLLLVAGGTGLAPLKALTQQVAAEGKHRRVTLVLGARTAYDLYDLADLEHMTERHPWLQVIPAIQDDLLDSTRGATAVDVALASCDWRERDAYICGSDQMVRGSLKRLWESGMDPNRIHSEPFAHNWYTRTTAAPGPDGLENP
jgi:NAD(P)H-flavin reductase/hemoglobin-like flavoprotein